MATNVLTTNQANGSEAGNTTGVVTSGTGSTVTSSTTQKISGSRSIKCVCAGSAAGGGVKTTTTAITVTPGPWTFTAEGVRLGGGGRDDRLLLHHAVDHGGAHRHSAGHHMDHPVRGPATLVAPATDGVLHVRTGETQACDLYVDELGAWAGVGGDWRFPGWPSPTSGWGELQSGGLLRRARPCLSTR